MEFALWEPLIESTNSAGRWLWNDLICQKLSVSTQQPEPLFPEFLSTFSEHSVPLMGHVEEVTRILLICHAEGMHNRYQNLLSEIHDDDSGLTALGWQQADKLASWLKNHERIEVLVSGAQLHSRLTAQRIGQALNLPVSVAEELPGRLGEQDAPTEVMAAPEELDPEIHTSTHNAVVKPYVEFHHALISTLVKVLQQYRGKTIALISSNSAIATILRHFFGAHQLRVQITYTGLSEIRYQSERWYLNYVNRTEHIPQEPLLANGTNASASHDDSDDDVSLIAHTYNNVAQNIEEWYSKQTMASATKRIEHLLHFAAFPSGLQILDLGSGLGLLTLMLTAQGAKEAIGVDISLTMLEKAEFIRLSNADQFARRVNFRLAPAQSMPFRNERFDAVVCRSVIHQSHNPERIMAEVVRVLKPGGIFILADLISDDDPVKGATQNEIESHRNPCHIAVRTKDAYRQIVIDAGFELIKEAETSFERDLEEWMAEIQTDPNERVTVREMIEASMETDAAGMNVRRQADRLVFDQHFYYLKAIRADTFGQ